jgi:hypothetical protein
MRIINIAIAIFIEKDHGWSFEKEYHVINFFIVDAVLLS